MTAYSLIVDIAFLVIIVATVILCTKRGLFKSISGIAGTVLGFIGARVFGNQLAKPIVAISKPIFNSIFSSEKIQEAFANFAAKTAEGITNIYDFLIDSGINKATAELISGAFERMGGSIVDFSAGYADGTLTESLAENAAWAIAPVIAFILLFVVIKILVSILCRLLSANIPIIRTLNKMGGFILGCVSALLIVILLCWGIVIFAPAESVGFFSLQTLNNSIIGGFIAGLFW